MAEHLSLIDMATFLRKQEVIMASQDVNGQRVVLKAWPYTKTFEVSVDGVPVIYCSDLELVVRQHNDMLSTMGVIRPNILNDISAG